MKIAIASGKGGTGKTTLATNLATYLSQQEAVVLIDLDVEEPNSGLFIQPNLIYSEDKFKMIPQWNKEKCTLCGKCKEVCNFNAVIKMLNDIMVFPQLCHSCFACSELCPADALPMQPQKIGELLHHKHANLDFIESCLSIGEEQAVPLIAQTLDYLKLNFSNRKLVILDSPPGTSCPVIEVTKEADLVILVTEPTPFGLHDLKLAVETMRELKRPFIVVINRFGIGNNDVLQYCEQENIEVVAKIPNDRAIAELYADGKLLKIEPVQSQLQIIADHIQKFRREQA